jgi:NADH-quinone oxidoreductase subunit H
MNLEKFFALDLQLVILLTALSLVVLSIIWLERKFLGRLQRRVGPTRTGPFGLIQPIADALKLIAKEDIIPTSASKAIFWFAPLAVFVPSFVIWVTIPVAQNLVVRNLELGLLFFIAFSVLSIVGVIMAGWASSNKYALLGGLRAAAQLISYEIPVILTVLAVAILAQSLSLVDIVDKQSGNPYILLQPLGLFIFFLAGLAEVGRTPFDIHFAESEIMGGPFIEYSGAHFAVFFLAEYINTFALAALVVLLYLGGWSGPLLPPILWFLLKAYGIILIIFWIRGTFPRLRIDQLMAFGWKVLIPLSFVNLVLTSFHMFYSWPIWIMPIVSIAIIASVFVFIQSYMQRPLAGLPLVHRENSPSLRRT